MKVSFVIVLLMLFVVSASAFDMKSSQHAVNVQQSQTIDDDLLASGNIVDLAGNVKGSALLAGNSTSVEGSSTGLLGAVGNSVRVKGNQQTVFLAGHTVDVESMTAKNLAVAGNAVNIDSSSKISRDVLAAGNSVRTNGTIGRNLCAAGNSVEIGGTIYGNVKANGQEIIILPDTVIKGDFTYQSPQRAEIAKSAKIMGKITYQPQTRRAHHRGINFAGAFLKLLMGFVFGAVLIALFPHWMESTQRKVLDMPGWSVLWGFIALIVTPIVAMIAFVTIIGVPVGFALLFAYIIALMIAGIVSSIAVGSLILKGKSIWLRFLVGIVILIILELIPVIGGLIKLAAIVFGLGAIWLNSTRTRMESA